MKKILIVDDELPLLKIMADQFIKQGFQVITAQDGADGLKLALDKHPDLIILDIKMPVMDGISMLEKLREDKWGKFAYVMVLTNATTADNIRLSMSNKTLNFCFKSDWKLQDLVKEVEERLWILEGFNPSVPR